MDKNNYTGVSYYRLKQVDYDGKAAYSNTIAISNPVQRNMDIITIYPNPAGKELNYQLIINEDAVMKAVITDVLGNIVMQENTKAEKGTNHLKLNISNLPQGMYCLKINNFNNLKFIKQ